MSIALTDTYEFMGETWTVQDWLDKMEVEGGVEQLLEWGGMACFPPSLRDAARTMLIGLSEIEEAIEEMDNDDD